MHNILASLIYIEGYGTVTHRFSTGDYIVLEKENDMGLIKAIGGAINGIMADQWKEYFYCDALPTDVLVTKGRKRVQGKFGSKNDGNDNIISNGSVIAVNEGQCMIIVDQGKITEFSAEAGEFLYDTSSEPSLLYGNLGENLKATFSQVGKRFTFAGDTGKDQRVYFFNTKEIMGNKYGTPNPIQYKHMIDPATNKGLLMRIRCNGEYSFRISDPLAFYTNVCGNVTDDYTRDQLESQFKSDLLTSLQPALGRLSKAGVPYDEITLETMKVAEALNEELSEKWVKLRGISIVSFGINTLRALEEDEKKLQDYQNTMLYSDPTAAAGMMVTAQAEAMKAAASNTATGPMMAFAGLNMAQQAGGMNANDLFAMSAQKQAAQPAAPVQQAAPAPAATTWTCSCGYTGNTAKFCVECGAKKPEATTGWTCSCGAVNLGKFCPECGAKKPTGAPLYRCDKCGWTPEDPHNPPKFCPECGDVFDENDIQ